MDEASYRITPKGVILLSLGGYEKEAMEQAEGVLRYLYEYMEKCNCAIICKDGTLQWVDVEQN